VEYEITDMGKSMFHALEGINLWIRENLPRVEQLRQTYDTNKR
jgi:DNA-binding HxlR family transcriptional regulator